MTETILNLQGEKVILREKRLSDAANDYRWRTDPELAELDAAVPLRMSFEQYSRIFADELNHNSPWVRRVAIETPEGQQIGNVMYYGVDYVKKEAELGILIGERDYWSKGYGTDAVDTFLHHIFTTTPFERIYLHTLDWNERAQLSFGKSGFLPIRPINRRGHPFILMELQRERWLMLQKNRASKQDGQT